MRLRNVKGAREAMAESRFVIQNPQQYKGKWAEVFQNHNPIHIEEEWERESLLLHWHSRIPILIILELKNTLLY